VDFEMIRRFDWTLRVTGADGRRACGEQRLISFAPIDGRLHAAAYTLCGDIHRLISLRKANPREQAAYEAAILARLARR
jgi:uncharacterized DUF497 family protein